MNVNCTSYSICTKGKVDGFRSSVIGEYQKKYCLLLSNSNHLLCNTILEVDNEPIVGNSFLLLLPIVLECISCNSVIITVTVLQFDALLCFLDLNEKPDTFADDLININEFS